MSNESLSEQISSKLLNSAQAARYCGYSTGSWVKARHQGWIGRKDLTPPPYIRVSKTCVMYEKEVLDKWLINYIKARFSGVKNVEVAA